MLRFLRKKKRSWIIVLMLGAIVLVFVLWGVGSNLNQPRLSSVATVNGEVISANELETNLRRVLARYQEIFRGRLSPETIENLNLRGNVLDDLIERRLALQNARRLGLWTTDEELMDAITREPAFQANGRFNRGLYLRILRARRLTPAQFEAEQREAETIRRLYNVILDSVHVTEAEVKDRYRIEKERIKLSFIRLRAEDFTNEAKITGEEIETYYKRNQETLKEPLRVQVRYLEYPFDHFSSQIELAGKEIEEFYNVHRDTRFRQPRGVELGHILFRLPAGKGLEEQRNAIRLKAEKVLREARAGADFSELAKAHSDDPSGAEGGDIGLFTEGQLLPSLEKAAFALKKDDISDLIESPSGLHILKVKELREERTQSLEEAKEEIVRTIKRERGREEAARAAESDREKALGGADLSEIAKGRGLALKVSRFFTRNEVLQEVGRVEEFYKTAFALSPDQLGPVLEGPNASYLVQLKERKEPRVPPLEEIRSDLEKKLTDMRAMELASQKARLLLEQLRKGRDIKRLASEHQLELQATDWFVRSNRQIPGIGHLQEFKPGVITISQQQPIPDQIYAQDGAVYLLAYKESQEADMEDYEKAKAQLRETALTEKRQRALQRFIQHLKAGAEIEVQPEFLASG